MKFLLALFLAFAIALPAVATNNAFDKAWSEAPPGWYLKISYNQGIEYYPNMRSSDWWSNTHTPPKVLLPENVLTLVSTDIDQRNKPIFVKKLSISALDAPPTGCLQDVFIFQVNGEELKIPDLYFSWSSVLTCRTTNKWELLRKSCGDENFLDCIAQKFSRKFPFDILFNLPSTQITCPKVSFFGSEFDLCFIYEVLRLMKYPVVAALLVKLFLYL